ncbi:MAG: hypothetical protein P1P86_11430 [Bacteroidales bacterium]|nr:hypothetical protein [Bacteroidales bacterium]
MPVDRNLGSRCKYSDRCPLFQGIGIPERMTRSIWRNVFCYRGAKGWNNCQQFLLFEKEENAGESQVSIN